MKMRLGPLLLLVWLPCLSGAAELPVWRELNVQVSKAYRDDTVAREYQISLSLPAEHTTPGDDPSRVWFFQYETILGSVSTVRSVDWRKDSRVSSTDVEAARGKWLPTRAELETLFAEPEARPRSSRAPDAWICWISLTPRSDDLGLHVFRLFDLHESTAARELVERILAEAAKAGLTTMPEPTELSLTMQGNINSRLFITTDHPVEHAPDYVQKSIRNVVGLPSDRVRVEFADEAETVIEGKLLHAQWPLERYAGRKVGWSDLTVNAVTTEGDAAPARATNLAEIFAQPREFHGKRVRVREVFADQFEGQSFGDPANPKFQVWLGQVSPFATKPVIRNAGAATIEGVFLHGFSGHMGIWNGTIERLTAMEAATTSAERDPD